MNSMKANEAMQASGVAVTLPIAQITTEHNLDRISFRLGKNRRDNAIQRLLIAAMKHQPTKHISKIIKSGLYDGLTKYGRRQKS